MLELIGLSRQEVYIANIIKCRPPNNRDPSPHEIDQCWNYLDKQIDLINPDLIVTLGRHSFGNFFPGELISQARGTPRNWNGRTIFPVYHPAATLHNPRLKPILEEDFRKMKMLINNTQIESEKLTKENLSETQLTFDFDAHELHETKKDNGNKL